MNGAVPNRKLFFFRINVLFGEASVTVVKDPRN